VKITIHTLQHEQIKPNGLSKLFKSQLDLEALAHTRLVVLSFIGWLYTMETQNTIITDRSFLLCAMNLYQQECTETQRRHSRRHLQIERRHGSCVLSSCHSGQVAVPLDG